MSSDIKYIVRNKIRILLFYGDTDAVCSHMHAQKFLDHLGLSVKKKQKLKNIYTVQEGRGVAFKIIFRSFLRLSPNCISQRLAASPAQLWYYKDVPAGFKTEYKGLTYTTILGTGHMAAQ